MRKQAMTPPPGLAPARFADAFKSPQFLAALVGPMALVGGSMLQSRVENKRQQAQKAESYREMMAAHPHLANKDQVEVNRIYNSLHRASPSMAKDPLVAGAWIDQVIENKTPGMNSHQAVLNAVKDLSGIEKNITDSAKSRQGMTLRWGDVAERGLTNALTTFQHARDNAFDQRFNAAVAAVKAREDEFNVRSDRVKQELQARDQQQRQQHSRGQLQKRLGGMIDTIRSERRQLEGRRSQLAESQAPALPAPASTPSPLARFTPHSDDHVHFGPGSAPPRIESGSMRNRTTGGLGRGDRPAFFEPEHDEEYRTQYHDPRGGFGEKRSALALHLAALRV